MAQENFYRETYNKIKKYMEKHQMIQEKDTVAAGVSGGADSVCLLHLLWRFCAECDFKLVAVHVNHNVRLDAGQDAAYVEMLCGKLGIPFFLKEVDMEGYARREKLSAEEAGRILRYEAFYEALKEYAPKGGQGKVAVAHNSNDRAETMLFHLFRGSGVKGLSSIQPVRDNVIRPLLCLERDEIERYLKEQRLDFREDSTNREDVYMRNKIRNHILPFVKQEICGRATEHMGELADILSETEEFLEEQTRQAYDRCVIKGAASVRNGLLRGVADMIALAVCALRAEREILQKRVILLCLEKLTPHRKDITRRHIEAIVELSDKPGSKRLSLPYGLYAYKEYNAIYLGRMDFRHGALPTYDIVPPEKIEIPSLGELEFRVLERKTGDDFDKNQQIIPENRYTKWFDYDKITNVIQVRTRRQGDYLAVDAAGHTKSLKEYMINEKIPKVQRDSLYLLADGGHVLWLPGYRISGHYKVDESTKRILQVQLRGGDNGGAD